MSDEAYLGLKASDAMKSALGDAEEKPRMRAEEMMTYLESAPEDPRSYDDAARCAGKRVLTYLRAHPEAARLKAYAVAEAMERNGASLRDLDLTVFMLGWAVNAARRCCELDEVQNTAIITFSIESVGE